MGYVREGTCVTCRYYSYEGEYTKGYCSWYKTYYYHDESCTHWEAGSEYSTGGTSGCFVTTACCRYMGLDDNCTELTALRMLRDEYLKKSEIGSKLVQLYYDTAPSIVESIEKRPDKDTVFKGIYDEIKEIVGLVDEKKFNEASGKYISMMLRCERITKEA